MNERLEKVEGGTRLAEGLAVTIVDLWQYRRAGVGVAVATIVVASAILSTRPVSYEVSSAIQVGSRLVEGRVVTIESPDSIATKVNEAHFLNALEKVRRDNPKLAEDLPRVTASVPKHSTLVLLKSQGSSRDAAIKIHSQIAELVLSDLKHIAVTLQSELLRERVAAEAEIAGQFGKAALDVKTVPLQIELAGARVMAGSTYENYTQQAEALERDSAVENEKAKLNEIRQSRVQIQTSIEGLTKNAAARSQHAATIRETIERIRQERGRVVARGGEAMTILLMDRDIAQQTIELERIETQLNVNTTQALAQLRNNLLLVDDAGSLQTKKLALATIESEKKRMVREEERQKFALVEKKLDAAIAEAKEANAAEIAIRKAKIAAIDIQLDDLQKSALLVRPEVSSRSVGISRTLLAAAIGIFSLLVGLGTMYLLIVFRRISRLLNFSAADRAGRI